MRNLFVLVEVPCKRKTRDFSPLCSPLDEKLRLTKAANTKPEWQSARLAMVLALNTTMRACEIKLLR